MNLAIVDQLELLPVVFERVVAPAAVLSELRVESKLPGAPELRRALGAGWLRIAQVADASAVDALLGQLERGEAETIVLARQLGLRRILMDERKGRQVAVAHGLMPVGILGVLAAAKEAGAVGRIEPVIVALRERASFHMADQLVDRVLRAVGER